MVIETRWANPAQDVVLLDVQGDWTWEMLHEGLNEAARLMDTVHHRTDVVIHFDSAQGLPVGFHEQLPTLAAFAHPRRDRVVLADGLAGQTALQEVLWRVFRGLPPAHLLVAATCDDALELLRPTV